MNLETCSYRITVTGLVQGVGFRPMVTELAEEYHLLGQVKNLGGVVEIIVSGNKEAVEGFLHGLKAFPTGRIDTIDIEGLQFCHVSDEGIWTLKDSRDQLFEISTEGFRIVDSQNTREAKRFLPVDFATCDRCKEELFDPNNRRYRYPFISCTRCGPRYSIQRKVPYDRENITMGVFPMCPECEKEYKEKGNIRRHAQTIACHDCGPQLRLVAPNQKALHADALNTDYILDTAIQALQEEKILAIKDIGGFHFAFSPYSSKAVSRLREFKARDKKPFAVMFFDMGQIKEYCQVSAKEEELLLSNARPIVLLNKTGTTRKEFVSEICGDSDRIGAMLPCNPLQLLLLKETGPLVMTSGNRGGEPIIIDDADMEELMKQGCPDMMLTHDREILTPLDDSIYQVNGEYVQLIRRARGLVLEPIEINKELKQDTFAAGGDLKASFALGRDNLVYMSQYFGDLEDVRCDRRRKEAYEWMKELLEIQPSLTVGDLHPSYVSAQNTQMKIQHHHAHVASVIAEHGLEGKVVGIACDGTGYGTDGTIWGCEVFLYEELDSTLGMGMEKEEFPSGRHNHADKTSYTAGNMTRVGSLSPVKLLGGDAGAKDADKSLFSYLMEAKERENLSDTWQNDTMLDWEEGYIKAGEKDNYRLYELAWKQNINTVYSSSLGRLFDAVAALLDICHYNSYEGECAILLEQAAHRGKEWLRQNVDKIPEELFRICVERDESMWQIDGVKCIIDLKKLAKNLEDLGTSAEEKKNILAYVFHHGISNALTDIAIRLCMKYHIHQIALSGGSFINRILLTETMEGLKKSGYCVYINEKVPCGDGGIALGQIFLAE